VQLIFYYVGFMALGDVADYLIGLLVERVWPQASLLASRKLRFLIFLAENARRFAAVHSQRAFHCFAR